jgi:hypothetical protein
MAGQVGSFQPQRQPVKLARANNQGHRANKLLSTGPTQRVSGNIRGMAFMGNQDVAHSAPRSPQHKRPDSPTGRSGLLADTSRYTDLPTGISRRSMWRWRLPPNSPIRTQFWDIGRVRIQHEAAPSRIIPLPGLLAKATNTSIDERRFVFEFHIQLLEGCSMRIWRRRGQALRRADGGDQPSPEVDGGRGGGRTNRPRR